MGGQAPSYMDVLHRPRGAERMQLIATIDDPAVIQRILAHLGLPDVGRLAGPVRRVGGAS